MDELPIIKKTEMLTVRQVNDRQVFTYQDLAGGFQVEPSVVRRQFARHSEAWSPDETGVSQIDTPSGSQDVRWFTARGAMRFCRYIKSGRSDALYNHLLDLWEAERNDIAPRDPLSELNRFAGMMNQVIPAISGRVAEIGTAVEVQANRLAVVEQRQKDTDPQVIDAYRVKLHRCKAALVAGTKGKPQEVTWRIFWSELKTHCNVGSFDMRNQGALTVPIMEKAYAFAQEWCRTRGVNVPTLFDDKAV